jgi:hypothetical protein
MSNNESVGKKLVEALKKQAENIELPEDSVFESNMSESPVQQEDAFEPSKSDTFADTKSSVHTPKVQKNFFDDVDEPQEPFFAEPKPAVSSITETSDTFEMPANIAVLKKLISQLPSGVSRHTGAQIIKQTMEALGISMKSVLQDAQQVQEGLKVSARECQASIQEYKKQILALEKQSQNYQKQYSALNDLISLFIQTTK